MIYETARSYIGTPFLHQGRRPGHGIDCVGQVICSIRDNGGRIEDFTFYGRDSDPKALISRLRKDFDEVPVGAQVKDDVLVFWVIQKNLPQHVGIYSGNGTFVHAYAGHSRGKVMEEMLVGRWQKCLHSVWRFRWQP